MSDVEIPSSKGVLSLAALIASYPLLTLKTLSQVSADKGSLVKNLHEDMNLLARNAHPRALTTVYRGFAIFMAYTLAQPLYNPQVWGKEKKSVVHKKLDEEAEARWDENFLRSSQNWELNWTEKVFC